MAALRLLLRARRGRRPQVGPEVTLGRGWTESDGWTRTAGLGRSLAVARRPPQRRPGRTLNLDPTRVCRYWRGIRPEPAPGRRSGAEPLDIWKP
jgi:hypothetical protein